MMPSRHSLRLAVGAAILALGIGACAGCTPSPTARGEVPPTLPPQSATPEPTASPSPTPTVASPSTPKPTPVSADPVAQDVYRYYRVLDELRQKPPRDPYKKLFAITRGEAFDMWQDVLVQQSFSGEHSTGFVKVTFDRSRESHIEGWFTAHPSGHLRRSQWHRLPRQERQVDHGQGSSQRGARKSSGSSRRRSPGT